MPFALRRARRSAAALGALAVVTALVAGAVAAASAVGTRAHDDGVARMIAQADPRDRTVVVTMPLGTDAEVTALDDAIARTLEGQSVRLLIAGVATAVAEIDGAEVELDALADATVPDRATLVSGDWPSAASEVALAEPAATRLQVTTGDTLHLRGGDVTVVGVWRATDAADPAWAGDPAVASGETDGRIGPLLLSGADAVRDLAVPQQRTTIIPTTLTVASAASLERALVDTAAAVDGPVGTFASGRASHDGGLGATLARALAAAAGASAALTVPVAVLLAIGAVIVAVIAFALARGREGEAALLIARGARRRAVWGGMLAETAAAAVVGALVGGALALLVAPPALALAWAGVAGVGAIVVTGAVAASGVARASGGPSPRSLPATAGMVLVVLGLAAAAGLALFQAAARGSLFAPDGSVDPLAAAAGWLTLLAFAAATVLLVGPAAALAERATRRTRGFAVRFGVLQLARRPHSVLAGVLSLVLAAAALAFCGTLALGAGGSDRAAQAAVGADIRVAVDAPATIDERNPALDVDALRGAAGIAAAHPAVATTATIGDASLRVLAASAAGFASMDAADDTAELLQTLAADVGTPLASDELTVTVTATDPTELARDEVATVLVTAWALDDDGAPQRLDLGSVPADGEAHDLSVARGPATRLVYVDLAARNLGESPVSVTVTAADGDAAIALDPARGALTGSRAARFGAPGAPPVDQPTAIPAVLTTALATRVDAAVGTSLSLAIAGTTRDVTVEVTGVAEALPGIGSGPGVALDAGSLAAVLADARSSVLIPRTVFVTASDTTDTAAADTAPTADAAASVRAWATHPVRLTAAADAGARPISTPTLVLFAAAAVLAALLGAVGFGVVFARAAGDRRAEALPLRSFGFDDAAQRRARTAERAGAAVFAIIAGALAGIAAALPVAPILLPALTGVAA